MGRHYNPKDPSTRLVDKWGCIVAHTTASYPKVAFVGSSSCGFCNPPGPIIYI